MAAGLPVMIEAGTLLDEPFWYQDDLWAGHYILVTGYDDAARTFIVQDTYKSADRKMSYDELDKTWQTFNRVYFVLYPHDQVKLVEELIGENLVYQQNRQNALDAAIAETRSDPKTRLPGLTWARTWCILNGIGKRLMLMIPPASWVCLSVCCATSLGRSWPISMAVAMTSC
jgi:hypothetical protein